MACTPTGGTTRADALADASWYTHVLPTVTPPMKSAVNLFDRAAGLRPCRPFAAGALRLVPLRSCLPKVRPYRRAGHVLHRRKIFSRAGTLPPGGCVFLSCLV